jgi:hypothetical protein
MPELKQTDIFWFIHDLLFAVKKSGRNLVIIIAILPRLQAVICVAYLPQASGVRIKMVKHYANLTESVAVPD